MFNAEYSGETSFGSSAKTEHINSADLTSTSRVQLPTLHRRPVGGPMMEDCPEREVASRSGGGVQTVRPGMLDISDQRDVADVSGVCVLTERLRDSPVLGHRRLDRRCNGGIGPASAAR